MNLPFEYQPLNAVSEIYKEIGAIAPAGLDDDIDDGSSSDDDGSGDGSGD